MNIYIYSLKDPVTNEIRYIGQTNDLKRRLNKHITNANLLSDSRHISNWIRSLTMSPIMDIVEVCDYSIRNNREKYWINYYKSQGYDLCNSSNGGAGAGIGNKNCIGRIMSEETRSKISLSKKGKSWGNVGRNGGKLKTVYKYTKDNQLIAVYKSIQEAVKDSGCHRVTIQRNIKNISSSKDFIWTDKPLH
jgi:hypothetical protein